MLSSSGGNNPYNNYNKRSYQVKRDELLNLTDAEQKAKVLDETKFEELKKKKESAPRNKLRILNFSCPDTKLLTDQVVALLKKTVVSAVIENLKNDQELFGYGTPAGDLSEGERMAIAFLYFLKSLRDKSFSLKNGIVVIDDPVTSQDSNTLFNAFGFMKEMTKDAKQLFILRATIRFQTSKELV